MALPPASLPGAKAPTALGPSPGKPPEGFLSLSSSWSSRESEDGHHHSFKAVPPPAPHSRPLLSRSQARGFPEGMFSGIGVLGALLPEHRVPSDVARRQGGSLGGGGGRSQGCWEGSQGLPWFSGLEGFSRELPADIIHKAGLTPPCLRPGRLLPQLVQLCVLRESVPSAHLGDELAGKVPHFSFPSPEQSTLPLISAEQNALFGDKGETAL